MTSFLYRLTTASISATLLNNSSVLNAGAEDEAAEDDGVDERTRRRSWTKRGSTLGPVGRGQRQMGRLHSEHGGGGGGNEGAQCMAPAPRSETTEAKPRRLRKKWLRRVNLHGFSNWIIPGASGPRRGAIVDRGRTRAIVDR